VSSQPIEAIVTRKQLEVPNSIVGLPLEIPALNELALRSLGLLYEEKEQLFSRRITETEAGLQKEETSRRQTIIALLGLQRAAQSGAVLPFNVHSILDAALRDRTWVRSAGDLGLLTWCMAECFPEGLRLLFREFDYERALAIYSDARRGCTRGLSWFLTGVAHAQIKCGRALGDLTDIVVDAYRLVLNNQGKSGIFGHARFPRFLSRGFWNRFGTIADQVHAVYALTTLAQAFQIEEPLVSALACANSICMLQGEMGQWWFLYENEAGRIVKRYPVLSQHQDGTAPLGLFALEKATGRNFRDSIYKGLSWVAGTNELGNDLRNPHRGLIWNAIRLRGQVTNYWEAAFSYVRDSHRTSRNNLDVLYEIRPDHYGWLLYAFGAFGLPEKTLPAATL